MKTLYVSDLVRRQIYPIVYSFIDGQEKFSFVDKLNTTGMQKFIDTRKGDKRIRRIEACEQLYEGDCFYITCIYHCERLIAFGDGRNDIDLFEIADEAYAVSNADENLKKIATGVIGDNNEDAVAKWLLNNFA